MKTQTLDKIVKMAIKIYSTDDPRSIKTFDSIKKRIINDINKNFLFNNELFESDITFIPLDTIEKSYKLVIGIPYYFNFKEKGEKNGNIKSK